MDLLAKIKEQLIAGDVAGLPGLVEEAIKAGIPVQKILHDGLIAGMDVIGKRFRENEIFIPEVLISAKAMSEATKVLEPLLIKEKILPKGKILIGTVKGDLHDIGKNIVTMMLKGAGFEVVDCGIDVAPEKFIEKVTNSGVNILAMSSLLTTSMPSMKKTIDLLKESPFYGKVKTLIGGAPVTQNYAREIGADGYAPDAAVAVDVAKKLLGIS
jgi:5-methyltetrahydrofolate--homocysteine methyltransferase